MTGFDIVRYQGAVDPDAPPLDELSPDFDAGDRAVFREARPFTMTTPGRLFMLIRSIHYIVKQGIPGDIVECGVWRGGSMMAAIRALQQAGCSDRHLHLYDTFEGMPPPTDRDVDLDGQPAAVLFQEKLLTAGSSDWCRATLAEVQQNLLGTGYPPERLHFVKGLVEETLPEHAPDHIALLRLDTDFYESTKHELEHLYPRLSEGGVLIIDDYGYWQGSREAVDEFLDRHGLKLLLVRIDESSARLAVKWTP